MTIASPSAAPAGPSAVPTTRTGKLATRAYIGCAILVAVAAVLLRFVALDRLLPHVVEPDAFWAYHLMELRGESVPDGVDFRERYPSLVPRLLSAIDAPAPAASVADALQAASQPFVLVRAVAALAGVLLAFCTWRIALRIVDRWSALVAALFVAVGPLALLCSTQARPHAVVAAACALTVLLCVRLVERPGLLRALAATLAAALALASLQNGVFALLPLALALWTTHRGWQRIALPAAGVALALALGLVWWPALPQFVDGAVRLGGSGAHELAGSQYDGTGFLVAAQQLFEHDPWLAVLVPAGLWALASSGVRAEGGSRAAARNLLLAHALPYLVVSGLNREFYERFLLPLLPLACLVAGAGAVWLVRRAANAGRPFALRAAALAVVLPLAGLVAAGAAAWWRLSTSPDTVEHAAAALPKQRACTTPYLVLPLLLDDGALDATLAEKDGRVTPWIAWQAAHRAELAGMPASERRDWRIMPARIGRPGADGAASCDAWLAGTRPDLLVLELSRRAAMSPAGMELLRRARAAAPEPLVGADGAAEGRLDAVVLTYQAIPEYYRRMVGARRFGPPVEVWRAP